MPTSSIEGLVTSLLSELPEESSPVVIVVKPERPTPVRPNGQKARDGPVYNPSMVYVLELATRLALKNEATMTAVGENIASTLQNVIRDASNLHPLVVSRVSYYLLNLLRAGFVSTY